MIYSSIFFGVDTSSNTWSLIKHYKWQFLLKGAINSPMVWNIRCTHVIFFFCKLFNDHGDVGDEPQSTNVLCCLIIVMPYWNVQQVSRDFFYWCGLLFLSLFFQFVPSRMISYFLPFFWREKMVKAMVSKIITLG